MTDKTHSPTDIAGRDFLLAVIAACAENEAHLRDQGGVDQSLVPTLADYRRASEAAHREHRRANTAESLALSQAAEIERLRGALAAARSTILALYTSIARGDEAAGKRFADGDPGFQIVKAALSSPTLKARDDEGAGS